jgi:hypothetical protein
VCGEKSPAGKIIPVIESIPSKKTGNFFITTPSTKYEGVWGRKTKLEALNMKYSMFPV